VAGANTVKKINSKLIHLEAGLRSFDERMIEERNRIYVDKISNYLLAPPYGEDNVTNIIFETIRKIGEENDR
jgi:UDP-N-acetylglucosamine 2-epimerase